MTRTWTSAGGASAGFPALAWPALVLLALLGGCPRGEDGGDAASPAKERVADGVASVAVRLSGAEGIWVEGAWLGMSPGAYLARHPQGGAMAVEAQWVEADRTGMAGVSPAGRSPLPTESAVFLDGALQGFAYTVNVGEAHVPVLVDRIEAALGEAAGAPPTWCEGEEFFAGYEPPADDARAWFWGDEQRRAVLVLSHDPEVDGATLLLAQVDELPGAIDACVDPLIEEMGRAARAAITE